MVPLIQSAHDYRCIHYYRLYKRLFHNPSFPILFSNGSLAAQWKKACPGTGVFHRKAARLSEGEGGFVCSATSCLRPPWFSLCLHHFRNICLSENSLHTLPSNFKLFFLISSHHTNSQKRRKSSNGSFFSLLQTQGMKRLKRSLQVNSEM